MDPLSLTVAAGAIANGVLIVSKAIYIFLHESTKVDQNIKTLGTEVEALSTAVESVKAYLKTPNAQHVEQFASQSEEHADGSQLWKSLEDLFDACKETLDKFHEGLGRLRGQSQDTIDRLIRHVRLNLAQKDFTELRARIGSHTTALQLVLNTINLRAACLVPGMVVADLKPQMDRLEKSLAQISLTLTPDGLAKPQDNYTATLKDTAHSVLYNATTVYNESVANPSLVGYRDHKYYNRIKRFLDEDEHPPSPIIEDNIVDIPDRGFPRQIHNNRNVDILDEIESPDEGKPESVVPDENNLIGHGHDGPARSDDVPAVLTEKTNSETTDDETTDSDDDDDEFRVWQVEAFLKEGEQPFKEDKFETAQQFLARGIEHSQKLNEKQKAQLKLGDARLMLAICKYRCGDLIGAETWLKTMAKEPALDTQDIARQSSVFHLLAQVYLSTDRLSEAKKYCERAMKRRHKVPELAPKLHESWALMSYINEAQGDNPSASVYRKKLTETLPPQTAQEVLASIELLLNEPQQQSSAISSKASRVEEIEDVESGLGSLPALLEGNNAEPPLPISPVSETVSLPPFERSISNLSRRSVPGSPQSCSSSLAAYPLLIPIRPIPSEASSARSAVVDVVPAPLDTAKLDVLKTFISYLPSSVRSSSGVIPLNQIDNRTPHDALLPWFYMFSADCEPYATPIHVAAAFGDIDIVNTLLQQRLSPIATIARDYRKSSKELVLCLAATPLHIAAGYGRPGVVDVLLRYNADPEVRDALARTPFHYAARFGDINVLRTLQQCGADPRARDSDGNTPLHLAASSGNKEFVTAMIDLGIDIESVNRTRCTALHLAARSGEKATVQHLLENGAEIDARDDRSRTPLHRAIEADQADVVRCLRSLDYGADVEARDRSGRTPLHTAASEGRTDIAKYLLETRADPDKLDNNNKTPRELAMARGHKTTAALFPKVRSPKSISKTPSTMVERISSNSSSTRKSIGFMQAFKRRSSAMSESLTP